MIIPVFVRERLYIPRAPDISEVLDELRSKFTYSNPEFQKRKAMGMWTGNVHPHVKTWKHVEDPNWGECLSLPRGGTQKVRKVLSAFEGVSPGFRDCRLSLPPINGYTNDVVLRPDQQRLAESMFKVENCLIRSPTASGKTETALKVVEWILQTAGPVLIIVWETGLMEQWIERIMKRFGLRRQDVGELGNGKKRILPITVGMQQTLSKQGFRYAHTFGGLIADEVQRFAAATYQNVIDIFPARYRIGISADESRSDRKEFLIYDAFGEVADEIERSKLIETGKIHDVIVRIVPTEFEFQKELMVTEECGSSRQLISWSKLPSEYKIFNEYLDSMCSDQDRNDLIWQFMEPNLKAGHSLQVVTLRVQHARYWATRIRNAGYNTGLLLGGPENRTEFNETVDGLRRGVIQAGVGTIQKSGVGHDIPRWNRGFILAPIAKNKQNFEQVVGRLRRVATHKTEAICYYFWDQHCYPHEKRQIRKRYPHTFVWMKNEFLPVT